MEKGDVALLRIPVVWERVTVMGNLMEEDMMVTLDVELDWFVAATTAGNLVSTTTRRMIVATILLEAMATKLMVDMERTGLNGPALVLVTMGRRPDPGAVMDPTAPEPSKLRIETATLMEVDTVLEEDMVLEVDTVQEEDTDMDLDLDPDMDMDMEEAVKQIKVLFIYQHVSMFIFRTQKSSYALLAKQAIIFLLFL